MKGRASLWRCPTWRFTTRRSETCSTRRGEMLRASLVILLGCWNNMKHSGSAEGLKAVTVSLFLQKPTSAESQRAQSFGALRGRSLPSGCDQLRGKPAVSFFIASGFQGPGSNNGGCRRRVCLLVFNRTSSL